MNSKKTASKEKKLTKKDKLIAGGLLQVYSAEGDHCTFIGDEKKTKINDPATNAVLGPKQKELFDKFKEDTRKLTKKLGIECEVKVIIKLI